MEIEKEGKLSAEAHKEGTEEFITVFDGDLTICVNEDEFKLKSGDSLDLKQIVHTYI